MLISLSFDNTLVAFGVAVTVLTFLVTMRPIRSQE